ncbi:Uncharacterised protein [Mycobacteroides abscessus subsp. abscessus]|nr:Uncharacterised protein [Mycobacteroides abscessus subsp. abscessus]SKT93416.1 Uncharacterised protein [Mycobacteroides abscessus subsp. abscessus]
MSTDIDCRPASFADSNIAALDTSLVVLAASLVGVSASALLSFVLSLRRVEDFSGGGVEGIR